MNIYKRLPQDEPLTVAMMRDRISWTDPNTRNRLETCRKLQKLADFAKLMGHSPKVHLERYHKHTKLKQHMEAVSRVMQRTDRPQAPTLPDD